MWCELVAVAGAVATQARAAATDDRAPTGGIAPGQGTAAPCTSWHVAAAHQCELSDNIFKVHCCTKNSDSAFITFLYLKLQ